MERNRELGISEMVSLAHLGNLTAVRLTILIPLVGYLIIFNANVVKYLDLAKEFVGISSHHFDFGVSAKLLLIYFGLCALAAGSVVFSIWCPTEVKHYGTSAAYVGADGRNIGISRLSRLKLHSANQ